MEEQEKIFGAKNFIGCIATIYIACSMILGFGFMFYGTGTDDKGALILGFLILLQLSFVGKISGIDKHR